MSHGRSLSMINASRGPESRQAYGNLDKTLVAPALVMSFSVCACVCARQDEGDRTNRDVPLTQALPRLEREPG